MSDPAIGQAASVDLRRSARARVRLHARYVSTNLHLDGVVMDVTPEGLFFRSDFLDSEGEPARLWLDVPSRSAPLELAGEVRWVNETPYAGGMGIRLVAVSAEARALLASLGGEGLAAAALGAAAGHA